VGLDDRDYMRERNRRTFERVANDRDRPFTPPREQPSMLVMILTWTCAGFVAYKGFGWLEARKAQRAASAVQQPVRAPQAVVASVPEHQRAISPAPAPSPAQRPVYIPAPAPQVIEAPRPRTGGTIYLCKDYSGGTFWASNHCNQHGALIDRMVSVPEGIPFEQQVQIAQQRRQVLESSSTTTTTVHTSSVPQASAAAASKALCESLDSRVNELDSMARQPQSGQMQDWIRTERQKTRDEQFRLRC
jgi:hypothetical protein